MKRRNRIYLYSNETKEPNLLYSNETKVPDLLNSNETKESDLLNPNKMVNSNRMKPDLNRISKVDSKLYFHLVFNVYSLQQRCLLTFQLRLQIRTVTFDESPLRKNTSSPTNTESSYTPSFDSQKIQSK